MSQDGDEDHDRWRHDGVRVIHRDELDPAAAQTPGVFRQVAIDHASVGARRISAGTVPIAPDAETVMHHSGAPGSAISVIRGRARMRWGGRPDDVAEAGPGDFVSARPHVPRREIGADPSEPLECVLARSDGEAVAMDVTGVGPVEKPASAHRIDPIHRAP